MQSTLPVHGKYSFLVQKVLLKFQYVTPIGVQNTDGPKNNDFRPTSCYVSETLQDR